MKQATIKPLEAWSPYGIRNYAGSLTPVAAPNASPNVFFGMGQDANQCVRIRRLKDVAWGPNVETGAGVPGYSGGLAACARVSFFFVAGVADPGGNVVFSSEIRGLSVSEKANYKRFKETTLVGYSFEVLH